MNQFTRRGFVGSLLGVAAAKAFGARQGRSTTGAENRPGKASIRITDLKCAIIGRNPVVRKPGLVITFNVRAAKTHLREEDGDFFD